MPQIIENNLPDQKAHFTFPAENTALHHNEQ